MKRLSLIGFIGMFLNCAPFLRILQCQATDKGNIPYFYNLIPEC